MSKSFYYFILLAWFFLISCEKNGDTTDSDNSEPVINLDWNLIWSDEFGGTSLDQSKWNILRWRPGWVNNELQAYTERDTNIYLENGTLVLRALIEPGYFDSDSQGNSYNADYTSGRINTSGKFSPTYGRVDIRAKLPSGRGSWPAIWMLGESISTVGWPNCGEIDIMEHVGFDSGIIHGSIHTEAFNHMNNTQKSGSTVVSTATDSFHVYSLEWTPDYLRYLVDESPFFFVYNNSGGDISQWPFDSPHFIILNLAIGGDWGGIQGIDPSKFPMKMLVDYVKVFKKSDTNNDVSITFQVDMKNVTVSGTGVWLSGGDLGSGQPGGIQMAPIENTDTWKVSLTLPKSSSFTYKYRNGYFPDTWSGGWESVDDECGVGQHNNRGISTGINDSTLAVVCFGKCQQCEE